MNEWMKEWMNEWQNDNQSAKDSPTRRQGKPNYITIQIPGITHCDNFISDENIVILIASHIFS